MTTLAELTEELAEYKAARHAILVGGQEYGTSSRNSLRRADLAVINEEIRNLEMRIALLNRGGVFGGTR